MSRRQGLGVLAAGLILLVAAPFVGAGLTPDPAGEAVTDLNAAAARALADPTPLSAAPETAAPSPSTGTEAAPTTVSTPTAPSAPASPSTATSMPTTASAPAPAVAPAPAAAPVRLQLPSLGIDNPVIPVGVTDAGDLQIPDDVDEVGWYRFGPVPGSGTGSAVLTGHVDNARQGAGPLSRLGELAAGDRLVVVDETGVSHDFAVLSREEWSKAAVPMDRLFDRGGSARLVLITCGGAFDADTGHYEDNVAITAVPVDAAAGGPA